MQKLFNWVSVPGGVIGGILVYLFGGIDVFLKALIALVVFDYFTGLIKASYTKTVSSEIGRKGILKKVLIFIVVSVACIIQSIIVEAMPSADGVPIREIVIMFFICNEGISILENAAEFIPIPQKLKDILIQLREKNKTSTDDSNEESEG